MYRSSALLVFSLFLVAFSAPGWAQDISATLGDSLETDAGADGDASIGDTLRYESDIANDAGAGTDGQTMVFDLTLDANTTLVPGSVNVTPLALDDNYATPPDTQLVVSDPGLGLFANDLEFLGDTFSLDTFDAASTEGGTVSVNADGTFTYDPPAAFSGTDTFTYLLADGGGLVSGPGLVTIVLNSPPSITSSATANADENQTAAIDVDSSDAEDTEGAGLTYSKTGGDDQALFSLNANSGVLTFSAAPDFETPGDNNTDNDYEVQVTVTDSGGLTDVQDITVTVDDVAEPPVASSQAHTSQGNVGLNVPVGSGLLDGATGGSGGYSMLDTQVGANATTQGGTITIADNGGFTYAPPAGFDGSDTFVFTIEDSGALTDSETVTFTVNTNIIWFVDPNDGNDSTGDGTLSAPFASLTPLGAGGSADSLDGANDVIFIFDADGFVTTADSGLLLETGQQLIGDGVTGTGTINTVLGFTTQTNSLTLPSIGASPRPILSTVSADTVQLATNNTLRGIRIGDSGVGYAISGTSFGTLAVGDLEIAGTGGLFDLITGTLSGPGGTGAATFDSMTTTLVTNYGIRLFAVDGSLTVSGATDIDTGPVGIYIQSSPGAAFDFGDTTVDGGVGVGVNIQSCAGATSTFDSLSITAAAGSGLTASVGGTINIGGTTNTINATGGPALDVSNTTSGGWTFSALSSTSSSTSGFNLVDVTGNITASGGSISSAASADFVVDGGSGNVTYDGSITSTSNYAVGVINRTGGTVDLNGTVTSTGGFGIRLEDNSAGSPVVRFDGNVSINNSTVTAVTVQDNTGATVHFADLDITNTTSNQIGLFATTNTGTLSSAAGTINTGSATAVDIDNTVLGMTLTSVSSSGDSAPGIDLNTTTGSFTVVGDGSDTSFGGNGTGGTIANKTGANASGTGAPTNGVGLGILLNSATNVTLRRMQLNDFSNFGIHGTSVTGFNFEYSTVDGTNGNSNAQDEASVRFNGLLGSASIANSDIRGGFEDNLSVLNTSGTLNRLTVSNSTIGLNSTASGNDGILIEAQGAAVCNMTVTDSTFLGARGDLIQANALGTSSMDIVLQDNTFSNTHSNSVGGGITLSGGASGSNITMTYDISGTSLGAQTFTGAVGSAITVNIVNGSGSIAGDIENNVIGTLGGGATSAGSSTGSGIAIGAQTTGLTHTALINNNQIYDIAGFAGVDVNANGDATINATVTNNTISEFSGFSFAGVYTAPGNTADICMVMSGNTLDATGVFGYFIDEISGAASYNFPGYTGPTSGGVALNNFLNSMNTINGSAGDNFTSANVTGTGSTCP